MTNLYLVAADVIDKFQAKKGNLKSLVIGEKWKNTKQLFALVVETLKYADIIEEILKKTNFLKQNKKLSKSVSMVLVYDFLFGRGIQCGGRYKSVILSRKSQLKSALAHIKVKRKVKENKDLLKQEIKDAIKLPKYIRINTLMTNMKDVLEDFKRNDFILTSKSPAELKKNEFALDRDVENLLIFHSDVDLHDNRLYTMGNIIFQDKASCMPAIILNPPPGKYVIDACSAPGNKTSHLAALLKNKGQVFAFDKSNHRLSTMNSMLLKSGVLCCQTKCIDFLKVNPLDPKYKDVEYILVDPSCSGSGIVNRMDCLLGDSDAYNEDRIKFLSEFQTKILNHALKFPKANYIVYSTCSIRDKENEEVVHKVLSDNPNFELINILPKWKNRGKSLAGFEDGTKCIRCSPTGNLTNGFFIALLCKKS